MNRALIIEDDTNWLKIFHATVGKKTTELFEYAHASSLEGALAVIEAGNFDIIILDLMLPDSNATDTIKKMTDRIKNIPIVVISTLDDEKLIQHAFLCGVEDYLVKDQYTADTFVHACRQAITRFLAKTARSLTEDVNRLIENLEGLDKRLEKWQKKGFPTSEGRAAS